MINVFAETRLLSAFGLKKSTWSCPPSFQLHGIKYLTPVRGWLSPPPWDSRVVVCLCSHNRRVWCMEFHRGRAGACFFLLVGCYYYIKIKTQISTNEFKQIQSKKLNPLYNISNQPFQNKSSCPNLLLSDSVRKEIPLTLWSTCQKKGFWFTKQDNTL